MRDHETGQKVAVTYRMGSDSWGGDIYSRVIYGARVSLIVGILPP